MDNPIFKPLVFFEKSKKQLYKLRLNPVIPRPSPMGMALFCIGILCGRATLFDSLRPFGGAFFAATFSGVYSYAYMLAAILGQILSGAPLYEAGKYIFAMTSFVLITERLPQKSKSDSVIRGGLFSTMLCLSGLCFLFATTRGFVFSTLYDVMLLLLECIVAFCAATAFHKAVPIIRQMKLSYSFSTAEEISLVSLLGCALWGAKDVTNLGVFNLSDIVCILIVLTFSIRLGSARGAIAGLTMGLVSALGSGRVDISCVSYGFSGLAASLAGGFGALPGCSAFILSNALITALANGSTEVLINIYDIFAACTIYAFIPEKVLLRITSFGSRDETDRVAKDERCYSEYVLLSTQNTVLQVANRLSRLYEQREQKNENDIRFFERVARRACAGCGMRRLCWSRDVKKTVSQLGQALTHYTKTGIVKPELLPENCLRPHNLNEAFVHMSEMYRIDLIWQGKMNELRTASQKQLEAFSAILSGALSTLSEGQSFDFVLADDIARRMKNADILCRNVIVMRDSDNDPTVMLSFSGCGGFTLCEKGGLDIVSAACGKPMVRAGRQSCKNCSIKYVVSLPSGIKFSSFKKSRDKKHASGDSVTWRVINKSLYAAVLCDGMGYGENAATESRFAAETLLDLIESGIDGEEAMQIANALFVPYGEVTFSATDLCLYNPRERTTKIIKFGGAASFTKSGERVDALYSKSMPLGSSVRASIETFTLPTQSGDIIVMVSDGVLETSPDGAVRDAWLINELEKFTGSPDRLSNIIVEKALEKCNNTPKDDITVLTAYIE